MTLPEVIQTQRLQLRPFTFQDVEDVFNYAKNPEWGRYLPTPLPYHIEHAEQFIAQRKLDNPNKEKAWAITLEGQAIGGVNLRAKAANHAICELGWSVAHPHWGKGFMTEVAEAIRDTAFNCLSEMHRLYARADLRNVGSWRVMEKIGMQREGVLRQHIKFRQEWTDEVWYAILRPEWEKLVEKKK